MAKTELKEFKEGYYYNSGKASDICRQLSFAGIALIWIFKNDAEGSIALPNDLLWPALFFIACLIFDLLQYVVATAIWGMFNTWHERRGLGPKDEVGAPDYLNWPGVFFFWGKIVLIIIGYVNLLTYVISAIYFN